MDTEFWHTRWEKGEIGFHEGEANALMVQHISALNLAPGARIFVPLCGKTRDIVWLLRQGYRVAAAELSKHAVEQFFDELRMTPQVRPSGEVLHYHAKDLDVFVGDIFSLGAADLAPLDAVYDRAALVALPQDLRLRYAAHLADVTGDVQQLVICFEYDQTVMSGPPFSVDVGEVTRIHGARYALRELATQDVPGGLKGRCPARETVWHLRPLIP